MFWDRVAGVYDIFVKRINIKTHKMLIQKTKSFFTRHDNVLECACGTGMLSAPVACVCKHLTATDFSENMLRKARKNCRSNNNISFMQANIMNLPFDNNSFDKVLARNVIHLLDEPMKVFRRAFSVSENMKCSVMILFR